MKHKKLLIAFTVLFSLAVCLGTFILIWLWGDEYPDFDEFSKGVAIPGLGDGAVPQGMCSYYGDVYDGEGKPTGEKQDYFFVSTHMKKGQSRIYVTGARTGLVGYVTMKCKADGSQSADENGYADYYGHAGGIATSCKSGEANGTFWMVSDGRVYCMKGSSTHSNAAEEIIAKARLTEGNAVSFGESFAANCNASFCFFFDEGTSNISNDKLYVGEFYHPTNKEYATDESHHITTKSGEKQYAFVYEYTASTTTKYGLQVISTEGVDIDARVPKIQAVYSVPEKIQGFARTCARAGSTDGKFVLSQSWALSNSTIYYYDYADVHTSNSTNREYYGNLKKHVGSSGTEYSSGIKYEGVTTNRGQPVYENPYVYFMDDSVLKREYSIPSMAEGLCVTTRPNSDATSPYVYVLFESASYKYKTFVRQQLKNVYYFIPREK